MGLPKTEDSLEQSFKPFLEDFHRSRDVVPEREKRIFTGLGVWYLNGKRGYPALGLTDQIHQ